MGKEIGDCYFCAYDKDKGLDYCHDCGRPLSIDALTLQHDTQPLFEERFKEVLICREN